MIPKPYLLLTAVIFGVIAVLHLVRAILCVPVIAGGQSIPVWLSWAGAVGAGALSIWGFWLARRQAS